MGTVSVSLPSDGQTIDAADYNVPINTIISTINGSIDGDNIADGSITNAMLDTTAGEPGGAWEDYTGTNTGISVGNGTVEAQKYRQVGKTVDFRYQLTCGSTTTVATGFTVELPVAAHAEIYTPASMYTPIGTTLLRNTGVSMDIGYIVCSSSTGTQTYWNKGTGTGSQHLTGIPFTVGAGDYLSVTGRYEAA